ncbi:serine/threonine-protein kinase ZRK1 [Populus alba]|uniref:serine/threonine-protein kinase ZRK1 n=1 Tax=Populus alba TaxID=43335 RepID=UPI00158A7137|nr:non-functional pseudokinase ZRK2-like [Populus alba]
MERKRHWIWLDKIMHKRERQRLFLDRGGELLEELIAFCNGRSNPIRNFSLNQLQKAIDDYHPSVHLKTLKDVDDFNFKCYEGILEQRLLLIKMFRDCDTGVYRDIVVSSQMSSHNNVLKLSGCCLEIPAGPALVFEYPENGCLQTLIHDGSLTWGTRLKIAKEIANAVTYLHSAFPRPTIHRDIKPKNIFLNQNYDAKLSNFSPSISIPEGESQVEEDVILGTFFFLDPVYFETGIVTEKTDVYSFGVLLLLLLTGRRTLQERISVTNCVKDLVEQDRVHEAVDPRIRGNRGEAIDQQQLEAFIELALRCTNHSGEDRPLMIEVAKELQRIERSITAAP